MSTTPTAGTFKGRTHILPVRVYYEDTDFTGVVYHANYLRYCERGRSDFLRAAGVDHTALMNAPDPTVFAVHEMAIKFIRPARIDDALEVRTEAEAVTGARLIFSQRILRREEEIVRARVEACCISPTGRPKRPPALLVEQLLPYLQIG
jgi:acyl-CoA thioester hydrolase